MKITTNKIFIDTVGHDYAIQIRELKRLFSKKLQRATIKEEKDGCYYLGFLVPKLPRTPPFFRPSKSIPDRTGQERYYNKIWVEDFITQKLEDSLYLLQGLRFAFDLAEKLQTQFPSIPFKVIFSFQLLEPEDDLGYCPRTNFHRIREGEQYLAENLNDYKINGILTIDTSSQPYSQSS